MDTDTLLKRLRAHKAELNALGVHHLSVFGSRARGDHDADSDVDLAVRMDGEVLSLIELARAQIRLEKILGVPVDLVVEPAGKRCVQEAIDRDRVAAF